MLALANSKSEAITRLDPAQPCRINLGDIPLAQSATEAAPGAAIDDAMRTAFYLHFACRGEYIEEAQGMHLSQTKARAV